MLCVTETHQAQPNPRSYLLGNIVVKDFATENKHLYFLLDRFKSSHPVSSIWCQMNDPPTPGFCVLMPERAREEVNRNSAADQGRGWGENRDVPPPQTLIYHIFLPVYTLSLQLACADSIQTQTQDGARYTTQQYSLVELHAILRHVCMPYCWLVVVL